MKKKLTQSQKILLYQQAFRVSAEIRQFISMYMFIKSDYGHNRSLLFATDPVYKYLEECSKIFDKTIDMY